MTSHAHEPSTVNDYMHRAECTFHSVRALLAQERGRQMHVVLQTDRHVRVPEVGEPWWLLVPEYRHKGKLDVVWCGPYKVLEVLNKGESIKLDIPAPFHGLRVFNRDSIKPYINREGQPVWECRLSRLEPPLDLLRLWLDVEWDLKSTAHSCTAVNGMTTRGLGSPALEEDPVYLEFLRLHPE